MKRNAVAAFTPDMEMVPALPVSESDDFDPSVPPSSGEDYLRRVRLEAAQFPLVSVASARPVLTPRAPSASPSASSLLLPPRPVTPRALLPSAAWQDSFVADFASMRLEIARRGPPPASTLPPSFPGVRDEGAWRALLRRPARASDAPALTFVARLDQPSILSLLEIHTDFLAGQADSDAVSEMQSQWLMALLLRMDTLLTADASTVLRSLCRACQARRLALKPEAKEQLSALNIIITVVVRYFNQKDLAENVDEATDDDKNDV